MTTKVKVLIVDDEPLIRNALEIAINSEADMEVVATAKDGLEGTKKAKQHRPDLILMDVQMPVMNGIDTIKNIRSRDLKVIILILTTFNEDEYVIEGLANGANGYLLKRAHYGQIIQSIREAAKGQYFLPIEVAAKLVNYLQGK